MQPACSPCDSSTHTSDYLVYQAVTANFSGPPFGTVTLQFIVSQAPVDTPSLPLLLDLVYLERQGYTGTPVNPTP